jgi:hypothetical protein
MNRRDIACVEARSVVSSSAPDIAFAQRLLALGRREGDRERLRLALPELMGAATTSQERDEVRKLVQRLLTARGPATESDWLDMRAAGRVAAFAYAWAIHRPDLVSGVRRRRDPLPLASDDWHEELMLALAACWQAMARESPGAVSLVEANISARLRGRHATERRWLQRAPNGTHLQRAHQLQATHALLEATRAAVLDDGREAQRRLAEVRGTDALGLLGLAHLARELAACVRFRLGDEPW